MIENDETQIVLKDIISRHKT